MLIVTLNHSLTLLPSYITVWLDFSVLLEECTTGERIEILMEKMSFPGHPKIINTSFLTTFESVEQVLITNLP
jgi:hypothetical protein